MQPSPERLARSLQVLCLGVCYDGLAMTASLRWTAVPTHRLEHDPKYLNLHYTLTCGQAFRWRLDQSGWWTGVVRRRIVRIRQEERGFLFQVYPSADDDSAMVHSYFRLEVDLERLYRDFGKADQLIAEAVERFRGLRVLRQEPRETLFSYVCSTANSVPRIVRSVECMAYRLGDRIQDINGTSYYAFPSAKAILQAPIQLLADECSLEWRAANLQQVAAEAERRGMDWPERLKALPYPEAKADLLTVPGVGRKIADSVCLFSLDKDQAVPVDTHIWAIARQLFGDQLRGKSLTDRSYERAVALFQERYGPYAGWAHEYLYMLRRASLGLWRP